MTWAPFLKKKLFSAIESCNNLSWRHLKEIVKNKEYTICYNSKTLEQVNKKNLILELIQENSIESFLQSSLPYIPIYMVCASYCAPYPKIPCVRYEVNM